MTKEEFIKKWNVAYESKEQELEFSKEMELDIDALTKQLNIGFVSKSLPSNEDIKKQGVKYSDQTNKKYREHVLCAIAYRKGAYWMRDLIKKK